jgi:hypothetical protein
MLKDVCVSCRRPKDDLSCELCHADLCKKCVQFLDAATFSFYTKIPNELSHTHYCQNCYAQTVESALEAYEEIIERARGSYVFFTSHRKQIPLLKKSKDSVRVENCEDRDETILRLAFLAAEQGYNSVMEVEVVCEKVRNEGYQKSAWRAVGIPATVDAEKMERNFR